MKATIRQNMTKIFNHEKWEEKKRRSIRMMEAAMIETRLMVDWKVLGILYYCTDC